MGVQRRTQLSSLPYRGSELRPTRWQEDPHRGPLPVALPLLLHPKPIPGPLSLVRAPRSWHYQCLSQAACAKKTHKALLRKTSPSMHRAPGRQTPLGSNKDPGRVSRAPPWAAWRGAKHAVLQSYVCTTPQANQNGQHPLMEGALFVLEPPGGMSVYTWLSGAWLHCFRPQKAQDSADFFAESCAF